MSEQGYGVRPCRAGWRKGCFSALAGGGGNFLGEPYCVLPQVPSAEAPATVAELLACRVTEKKHYRTGSAIAAERGRDVYI
jgi:hypothetical protein